MKDEESEGSEGIKTGIAALGDAEARLRNVAAKAASEGDYDTVVLITHWAKTLGALMGEVTRPSEGRSETQAATNGVTRREGRPQDGRNGERRLRTKGVPLSLPSFSRDADYLVKHALSRKSHSEYEHRAPADVVFAVADCIGEWRSTRKLLSSDQLMQSYSKRKGKVVSYQIYVALAWLAQVGLVRRHGRSGYSVPSPTTISHDVQAAWAKLGTSPSE